MSSDSMSSDSRFASLSRHFAAMARRYWLLVAALSLLGGAIAALYVSISAPLYEARAELLVKFGREYVYRPEVEGLDGWQPSRMMELVNGEVRILGSRNVKTRVLNEIGAQRIYPGVGEPSAISSVVNALIGGLDPQADAEPRPEARSANVLEAAIEQFDRDLNVRALGESSAILLAYRHPNPELAQAVLVAVLDSYQERRAEVFAGADSVVANPLLERAAMELERAQADLADFLARNIPELAESRLEAGVEYAGQLHRTVLEAEARVAEQRSVLDRVSDELRTLATARDAAGATETQLDLERRLEAFLREATAIGSVAGSDSLAAAALREREAELSTQLRDAYLPRDTVDAATHQRAEHLFAVQIASRRNLAAAELERDNAKRILSSLSAEIAAIERGRQELDSRRGAVAAARERYQATLRHSHVAEELDLLGQLDAGNVEVIDAPHVSHNPLGLSGVMRVALAMVFGAIAGLCLAALREHRLLLPAGPQMNPSRTTKQRPVVRRRKTSGRMTRRTLCVLAILLVGATEHVAKADEEGGDPVSSETSTVCPPGHRSRRDLDLAMRKNWSDATGGQRWAQYEIATVYSCMASQAQKEAENAEGGDSAELATQAADPSGNESQTSSSATAAEREAFDWYLRAARQGLAAAQLEVARFYAEGRVVEQSYAESARWLKLAARQGEKWARYSLAEYYAEGRGVPKDDAEATKLYGQAAEAGIAWAQYAFGLRQIEGLGAQPDPAAGVVWLKKAADNNVASAFSALAELYAEGRLVAKDDTEAALWYRKAAEAGDVYAQAELADRYDRGLGVPQSDAAAAQWRLAAAEQGDDWSQINLAERYLSGKGVTQDPVQAANWFERAAEAGNVFAQTALASLYDEGRGVPVDQARATAWFAKAASAGYRRAQYDLALRYADGIGVERSRELAVEWLRKAAEQGHTEAQLRLAEMLLEGDGRREPAALDDGEP